ncbi:MAG: TonB-dependent receptor [Proteobacteria bacterium]|nr:MAG: TonB-dependent receptor [Pseudomonadota bacterium]
MHKEGGGGYVNIRDEGWCRYQETLGSPCVANQTHQIFTESTGNKDLDPEVGRTYTIGFTYEPITDLYFKADYAGFYIKDEFSVKPIQDIVDDYYANRGLGSNRVNLDSSSEYITSVNNPYTNIGWSAQYLIKGEAGYKFKIGDLNFDYNTDGSRTLSSKSLRSDGTVKQYNGLEGSPRWRWNNAFTTHFKPVSWTVSTMTIAMQEPDPENMDTYTIYYYNDQVDEFTQYNTSVHYDYLDSGSVTVGVNNLFDKLGGTYRTGNYTGARSTNSSLYGSSYYGLSYFMNITQNF